MLKRHDTDNDYEEDGQGGDGGDGGDGADVGDGGDGADEHNSDANGGGREGGDMAVMLDLPTTPCRNNINLMLLYIATLQ